MLDRATKGQQMHLSPFQAPMPKQEAKSRKELTRKESNDEAGSEV